MAQEKCVNSFDGVPIHYKVQGNGDLALMFVHGWACDKSHWDAQVTHFAPTYKVVTLDLAGHGKSGTGRKNWTMENFARDVQAVVEQLELEQVVLIGHSMGGPVILEAAQLLADRVAGLVGVDTFIYPETYLKRSQEEIDQILPPFRANFTDTTRGLASQLFSPNADPALIERVASGMSATSPIVALPALEALLAWDLATALQKAHAPIRCICSRDLAGEEAGRDYNAYFNVTFISGAGHFVMMEAPDVFNRLLTEAINN
jgi:pimeloyl-ACP methyl ester carboxylesterase